MKYRNNLFLIFSVCSRLRSFLLKVMKVNLDSGCARIRETRGTDLNTYLNACGLGGITLSGKDIDAYGELEMIVLPEILEYSNKLDKVDEVFCRLNNLERCYSSSSRSAAVAEFLTELAQLEGASLNTVREKAISDLRKVLKSVLLLTRIKTRTPKIVKICYSKIKESEDLQKIDALSKKLKRIYQRTVKNIIKSYTLLSEAVDDSWKYFPVEIHEILQDWADSLSKSLEPEDSCAEEISENSDNYKSSFEDINNALITFVTSIRKASEDNQLNPKLRITELSHFKDCLDEKLSEEYRSQEDEWGYTQEDRIWLDSDLSDLEGYGSYNFEPGERESFKPVRYIPGRGFVIFEE